MKVTIGLVQMKCGREPEENLERAKRHVLELARRGAQIVCLPELFLSEYFCQGRNKKHFSSAEPIPGPTTRILSELAHREKITIVASLFEKAGVAGTTGTANFFNSTAVIGPNGKIIGKYRKIHIPSLPPGLYEEDYYFKSGDLGFPVFKTPRAKISALVCYDQWFPEAARISAVKGAQILFYPTAIGWPAGQCRALNKAEHEAWITIQRSHAIANNVFVAAVNRAGREGSLNFWGSSFVSDPYGRILAQAGSSREENLLVECDFSIIGSMRKEWPFLEERRIKLP